MRCRPASRRSCAGTRKAPARPSFSRWSSISTTSAARSRWRAKLTTGSGARRSDRALSRQRMAAAEQLQGQIAAEGDPGRRAALERSLETLVSMLEGMAPEVDREKQDATDAKDFLEMLENAYAEAGGKLKQARCELERARRDMARAGQQRESAERQAEAARQAAGLTRATSSVTVALKAMQEAARATSPRPMRRWPRRSCCARRGPSRRTRTSPRRWPPPPANRRRRRVSANASPRSGRVPRGRREAPHRGIPLFDVAIGSRRCHCGRSEAICFPQTRDVGRDGSISRWLLRNCSAFLDIGAITRTSMPQPRGRPISRA